MIFSLSQIKVKEKIDNIRTEISVIGGTNSRLIIVGVEIERLNCNEKYNFW